MKDLLPCPCCHAPCTMNRECTGEQVMVFIECTNEKPMETCGIYSVYCPYNTAIEFTIDRTDEDRNDYATQCEAAELFAMKRHEEMCGVYTTAKERYEETGVVEFDRNGHLSEEYAQAIDEIVKANEHNEAPQSYRDFDGRVARKIDAPSVAQRPQSRAPTRSAGGLFRWAFSTPVSERNLMEYYGMECDGSPKFSPAKPLPGCDRWVWMMDWCRRHGVAPGNDDNWTRAGLAADAAGVVDLPPNAQANRPAPAGPVE